MPQTNQWQAVIDYNNRKKTKGSQTFRGLIDVRHAEGTGWLAGRGTGVQGQVKVVGTHTSRKKELRGSP